MTPLLKIAADPGLQPQRTALSWTRTASSMLMNAVICVRSAYVYESRPLSLLAVALLAASALGFWFGKARSVQLASDLRSQMEVPHMAVLALTAASCLAATGGLLAIAMNHNDRGVEVMPIHEPDWDRAHDGGCGTE